MKYGKLYVTESIVELLFAETTLQKKKKNVSLILFFFLKKRRTGKDPEENAIKRKRKNHLIKVDNQDPNGCIIVLPRDARGL